MAQERKVSVYVKQAALAIDRYSNHLLGSYDLTNAQFKVLKYVFAHENEPVRSADIESHFYMTNPTATGIIQNLEKRGLIRRIPNPLDGRSKLLVPTESANRIKDELFHIGQAIDDTITANLTPQERDQLVCLLAKMLGREPDQE